MNKNVFIRLVGGLIYLCVTAHFALADHTTPNCNNKDILMGIVFQSVTEDPKNEQCHLYKLNFSDIQSTKSLRNAYMDDFHIQQSDLREFDLTNSMLRGASFEASDSRGANYENAIMSYAKLLQSDFRGANFTNADLRGVTSYETSHFAGADFTNALVSQDFAKYLQKRGIEGFLVYVEDADENTDNEDLAGSGTSTGAVANIGSEASNQDSSHPIHSVSFQRIEAGSFTMGSPESEKHRDSDEDQVQVTISKPFEIMATEVTQRLWVEVMGENPSKYKYQEYCDDYEQDMCPNNPVEWVSWYEVKEFIEELNNTLSLTGCDGTPNSAKGCYRLPTEAEWEYVARAGTTTAYSFGDDSSELEKYAWYDGNSGGQTHEVGLKDPNPWGLYDVHGNVWEWVEDKYKGDLLGGEDPLQTSGSVRVVRGGSWLSYGRVLRSAIRGIVHPASGSDLVGFRLVRTL